jgi:pilus assembly protein Flp/PilA
LPFQANCTPGIKEITLRETTQMKDQLLKLSVKLQILLDENGQDLIEYALVVALIAFAAVATMSTVASDINTAFGNIGTKLTSATQ